MKYRVQITVSADRLPGIIDAAFKGQLNYDPDPKIYPIVETQAEAAGATYALHPPPKPKASRHPVSNNRQILVEAALKTGPKRWGELKTALSAGGISESSLNNLISKWQKEGKIRRSGDGLWSLNDEQTQAAHAE